jgi:hypothetical protein
MSIEEAVNRLKAAAVEGASGHQPLADSLEARAAYARGVRAMAGLVHACVKVADTMADQNEAAPLARDMLKGYASSLRLIVSVADDLIPPGWEV